MMNIGDKAPEILGKDEKGRDIRLSDYSGRKLVLYFYPKDNTSGCTAEACSLRDHYDALQARGYEVVGVSKDSAASHQKFKEKHQLPFPLIADVNHELLEAMGAWGEKSMYGKKVMGTIRTTFVINEEGVIEQIMQGKQIKTKEHAEQILGVWRQSYAEALDAERDQTLAKNYLNNRAHWFLDGVTYSDNSIDGQSKNTLGYIILRILALFEKKSVTLWP